MAAPLDLDQLQTFVAIADTGSFTRAADEVHRTQSAVSMQMRRLEERIGKPLFEKDGRSNRLTEEGERLLSYARRLIHLNRETLAAFDDRRARRHDPHRHARRLCRPLPARDHGALRALQPARRADRDLRADARALSSTSSAAISISLWSRTTMRAASRKWCGASRCCG